MNSPSNEQVWRIETPETDFEGAHQFIARNREAANAYFSRHPEFTEEYRKGFLDATDLMTVVYIAHKVRST